MKSLAIALLCLGACTHAASQTNDPCTVAGIPGSMMFAASQIGNYPFVGPKCHGAAYDIYGIDTHLSTQQLIALKGINTHMADMKATIGSLKEAIDNLNKATKDLVTSNTKWRADTLDAAIKGINAVPVELAGNAELRAAMTRAVADALLNDPQFVQQVQAAKE